MSVKLVFIILGIIFYVVRYLSQSGGDKKKSPAPSTNRPRSQQSSKQPQSIDDIFKEFVKEVESANKKKEKSVVPPVRQEAKAPVKSSAKSKAKTLDWQQVNHTNIQAKKQLGYRVLDHDEIQNGEVERSFKMSFDVNDQFLLGGKSVGAFLYLSPINLNTLSVDGDTKQSRKQIKGRVASQDTSNGLSVDIVFQYRMTDYYGNNATQDRGRIGGQAKLTFPNLTYTKKIGLDIFDKYDEQFSFDLEVFAKYRSKGKSLNSIRAARLIRR